MHARANLLEIDKLTFKTNVLPGFVDTITEPPETGCILYGLYIQGFKWDPKRRLVDEMDHKVPLTKFPCIWLEPMLTDELIRGKTYETPLYKTSERKGELTTTGHSTNFIMYLDLPTDVTEEHWIRRGAAMLCMTDD
jgi:dynein heavy chain